MDRIYFTTILAIIIPPLVLEILFPFGLRNYLGSDLATHPAFNADGRNSALILMTKYSRILRTLVIAYTLFIESVIGSVQISVGPWATGRQFLAIFGIFATFVILVLVLFFQNRLKGGPLPYLVAPEEREQEIDRQDKKWRRRFLTMRWVMYLMNSGLRSLPLLSP